MSEYENQLKRMRDAFAASIVKSMTPEEINNTFQKLHDENERYRALLKEMDVYLSRSTLERICSSSIFHKEIKELLK